MKKVLFSQITIVILAFQGALNAQQAPSTQPGLDYFGKPEPGLTSNVTGFRANFKISPDVDFAQAQAELPSLLALAWTRKTPESSVVLWVIPDSARMATSVEDRMIQFPCSLESVVNEQELFRAQYLESMKGAQRGQRFYDLASSERKELADETVRRLKQLVTSDLSMSSQQRKARLAEVESGLALVTQKIRVLETLTKIQPTANAAEQLTAKVNGLRQKEDELQMKLSVLQARRRAVEQGIQELRSKATSQRDNPKITYLQEAANVKQHEYDRKAKAGPGAFNQDEIEEAKADFAQAKAALAIAQAEAEKGPQSELMDRLTNELTTISIDSTDAQIQLHDIGDMLSKYDPADLNEAKLTALLKADPGMAGGEPAKLPPPLYYELLKQQNDLRREKLALLVDDVVVIPGEQPAPGPTTR